MTPPLGPVFLTGGTGLVGSHVARLLCDAKIPVIALHRPTSDTSFLRSLGCQLVPGDVTGPAEDLERELAEATAVVHAAAVVYGKDAPVLSVNVEGTRAIAAAARGAGVRRFVHLSSVAAYGPLPAPIDEETPLAGALGPRDHYARSKRQSERVLRDVWTGEGRRLTVFRPSTIYGERDRGFTLRLARLATLPVVPLLGTGTQPLPVVYAGNLASAIVRALRLDAEGTFVLAEDEPTTQEQLVLGLARALGRRPRAVRMPQSAVDAVARVADRVDLRVPGAPGLAVARAVRLWTGGNPYESGRVRTALDWRPEVARETALAATARWLVESDHAPANRSRNA